ncbi:spermidine synthase [Lipingzhangella sp. LS1_29]|uniref:Spermidine synthase n=1 Tax=Lipingzhangella rawalii TaxID=2055835 RepID=A0ABU2H6Y2_9ACTN|nr:spermidine synthase [Lipingzhangella rawalii]MDS1270737.1 spermidine synthase [Lipingzhangella rawalii]
MSARIQELDWQRTAMGELSLRRRWDPQFGEYAYEVRLGEEFLMSSLFPAAEVAMTHLALAELDGTDLTVAVGGLGLGYTAAAVLEYDTVDSLLVVEALAPVVDWHRRGLIPSGAALNADARCRLVEGDFFGMVADTTGLDPEHPGRRFDAILLDIDHSPLNLLHSSHAGFYTPEGLRRLAGHLTPGGVFALWSDDPPEEEFTAALREVFHQPRAEVVPFVDRRGGNAANTIYLARAPGA